MMERERPPHLFCVLCIAIIIYLSCTYTAEYQNRAYLEANFNYSMYAISRDAIVDAKIRAKLFSENSDEHSFLRNESC